MIAKERDFSLKHMGSHIDRVRNVPSPSRLEPRSMGPTFGGYTAAAVLTPSYLGSLLSSVRHRLWPYIRKSVKSFEQESCYG